jgi:nitrogen fixation/metabolism regulation signal transduction histidine kinase
MSDADPIEKKQDTWYASADRSSDQEIAAQARYFLNNLHFSRLYDAVPDIVMILNENRQIVFANAALLDLLSLPREEFRGGQRVGEILDCAHASDPDGNGCGTTEFCTTCGAVQAILGGLGGRIMARECRILREDGDPLDLYVWASPLHENGGDYSVVVVKDISNEKRRQALEQVFFHDVMNVVNKILISADMLQGPPSPSDDDILRDSLLQLSQQLAGEIAAQRDLAAAETNELTVHPAPLGALDLMQSVIRSYEYVNVGLAVNKTLRIAPEAHDVTITSDRVLLERVLGNMVKNALEASASGDTVTLDCRNGGPAVEFSVHNPAFMPRYVQLQVFQRSFSTKGVGRGLGTFSVKLLTERYLGGSVSFTSSKRGGTTFKAVYPLTLE